MKYIILLGTFDNYYNKTIYRPEYHFTAGKLYTLKRAEKLCNKLNRNNKVKFYDYQVGKPC